MIIHPDDVILCGMPVEQARLAAAMPRNLILSGVDKLSLETLVPPATPRIISMGVFGGLSRGIAIADVVLASTVSATNGPNVFTCDPVWNGAVLSLGWAIKPQSPGQSNPVPLMWNKNLVVRPWFSSGALDLADTASQRAALNAATGAWAIDDESYYAAAWAKAHDKPFNVCRSCSDTATETLPPAARGAIMTASGGVDVGYLITQLETEGLAADLDLIKIAQDMMASLDTLEAVARALRS